MTAVAVSKAAEPRRRLNAWIPAAGVLAIMAASKVIYNLPWPELSPVVHQPAAFISAITLNLAIVLGPSVIYLMGRFRGAGQVACIKACLITPVAWNIWEIFRVTAYFSVAESLYYGLNSLFLGALAAAAFQMGLWEAVYRLRRRGEEGRVRLSGPVLAAVTGLILVFIFDFWAMGQNWFYFYQAGYKALFF